MQTDEHAKDEVRRIIEEAHEAGDIEYVTPREAAAVMNKSPATVVKWIKTGDLAGYKVRDRYFVPVVRLSEDPGAPITSQRILMR